VVEWIDEVIMHADDAAVHGKVRSAVNEFMQRFPLYEGVTV
jgi:glycine/serine hydroxymethyltransferase